MELKDFISIALIEICEGIALAKDSVKNGAIAPHRITTPSGEVIDAYGIEKINFEVCVTVEDNLSNNQNKSIGIMKVISAGINSQHQENFKNASINKIAFSVPFVPSAIIK